MNGVEYLRSCSTSVHEIQGVFELPVCIYSTRQSETVVSSCILDAAAELRERDQLCLVEGHSLWVFGVKSADTVKWLAEKEISDITDSRLVDDDADPASDRFKLRLLGAIERAVAYTLSRAHSLLHIAPWTWLFWREASDNTTEGSTVLQILPRIVDGSALVLSTITRACSLQRLPYLTDQVSRRRVTLAPSGADAILVASHIDVNAGSGEKSWKTTIMRALRAEGISIRLDEPWVRVRIIDESVENNVLWPSVLCVTTASPSFELTADGTGDWRRWFDSGSSTAEHFRCPLGTAEDLHGNYLNKSSSSPSAALFVKENERDVSGAMLDGTSVLSPPFSQRVADHHSSMVGIYPTPPDGLAPGHVTHNLPTSDVSTAPPYEDIESANEPENIAGAANTDSRESIGSSSISHRDFQAQTEDLFGDMAEPDFGTNEVGDADFDYFDVPDHIPRRANVMEQRESEAIEVQDPNARSTTFYSQMTAAEFPDGPAAFHNVAEDSPDLELSGQPPAAATALGSAGTEAGAVQSRIHGTVEHDALSPFGIRERLLPPPIPASAGRTVQNRDARNSNFEPILFNDDLDLSHRYTIPQLLALPTIPTANSTVTDISIALPQRRARAQSQRQCYVPDSHVECGHDSSDEGSDNSTSSMDDKCSVLKTTLHSRKRKRAESNEAAAMSLPRPSEEMLYRPGEHKDGYSGELSEIELNSVQQTLLGIGPPASTTLNFREEMFRPAENMPKSPNNIAVENVEGIDLAEIMGLDKLDLIYVAQLIGEQSISAIPRILHEVSEQILPGSQGERSFTDAVRATAEDAVVHVLPQATPRDLSQLALFREPPTRQALAPSVKIPTPSQRPPQRLENQLVGPEYFPLTTPLIRVQRGVDSWEMLPSVLKYWNALGLGPAHGPKDARHVCLVPASEDLSAMVCEFMHDVEKVYEDHKYGTLVSSAEWTEQAGMVDLENFEEGILFIPTNEPEPSYLATVKAIAMACSNLGKGLAQSGHMDPERTFIVVIVNPFGESNIAYHHLCMCFWILCKAYRDEAPRQYRTIPRSDIVLRIIPVDLIASSERSTILTSVQLRNLASEIYDQCPPSSKSYVTSKVSPALYPLLAAPAVELASSVPKRIAFQLTSDPPSDLLHEGSTIHLAFALSEDREWAYSVWIDSTGRFQKNLASCLRGRNLAGVLSDIWNVTLDILDGRDVTWRVFVAGVNVSDVAVQECWRNILGERTRRQMLHVVLLTVQEDPDIQVFRPVSADATTSTSGGQGFLTPGSTPQATNANVTVSPSDVGVIKETSAPLTPAPSDGLLQLLEVDTDAHLLSVADESWGILLSPSVPEPFASLSGGFGTLSGPTLARAMLLKRGRTTFERDTLPALYVSLHSDARVRPNGQVDEGPTRQAVMTLREVLRMYRNLSLLSCAKHLVPDGGVLPVHIFAALMGSRRLSGF